MSAAEKTAAAGDQLTRICEEIEQIMGEHKNIVAALEAALTLFETQPNDPGTLALAGAVLLAAAILAGYAPARRASRIDPLAALRRE